MMKKLLALAFFLAATPCFAQFADQNTYVATTGGSANAQTFTLPNASSYADVVGVNIKIVWSASNNAALTLAMNGGAAKAVLKPSPGGLVPLTGGEVLSAQPGYVMYDGTEFVLESSINSTLTNIFVQPQGYLTPCQTSAGSPVTGCTAGQLIPTGDVTATTTLYYEPAFGNQIPIWNGSQFVVFQFTEAQGTLALNAAHLANTLYDVCVFSNSGVPLVVTSVAWSTSTIGSGARGSGAGTAQIAQVAGIWTNAVAITARNGGTTYSVPANQCTMVASLYMDGTNGQASFTRTFGQNRKWATYNFWNQQDIVLVAGDSTSSWSYTSATVRPSNGTANNSIFLFTGLPLEPLKVTFNQNTQASVVNSNSSTFIYVGWNSTTLGSGSTGINSLASNQTVSVANTGQASYTNPPAIGVNKATSLESGAGTNVFSGNNFMLLATRYKG